MVSDSDKHYAYLEDPDDIDLNNEFSRLNEDEVKDLKHEYVLFGIHFAWLTNDYQVGNTATWPSKNSTTSSPTSRRKSTRGFLRNSASFMQR